MKKLIILVLLMNTSLFAQHRAIRIDSLEINDKNVTAFFDDLMTSDLMKISLDTLLIFTASDSSDTLIIIDDGDSTRLTSENPIKLQETVFTKATALDSFKIGGGIWIRKVFMSTGGDSLGTIYYNTVAGRADTVWMTQ